MIFPYLKGFLSYKQAPVTWTLLFLNLMVFVTFSLLNGQIDRGVQGIVQDQNFLKAHGRYYSQFVLSEKDSYSDLTLKIASLVAEGNTNQLRLLGGIALRDPRFQQQRNQFVFTGDQVEVKWWKEKANQLEAYRGVHLLSALGLSGGGSNLNQWVTYQFTHNHFLHLFGNMVFLFIFGCLLESVIGGASLLIVYLLSGLAAAGVFLLNTGFSLTPLIGASGSVSGIATLFCIFYWRRSVRYIFLLFPKRGYFGFIYLPGWVAFIMWAVADVTGYLSTFKELGGIAYTAHMGGEIAGGVMALTILVLRSIRGKELLPKNSQFSQPVWTIRT